MSTLLSAVYKEFLWSTETPLVAGKKSDGFWNRKVRVPWSAFLKLFCHTCWSSSAAVCWWHLQWLTHPDPPTDTQFFNQQRKSKSHRLRSQIFEGMWDMGSLESYGWKQNWEKIYFVWVCGKCSTWGRGLSFPDCWQHMKPGSIILNWRQKEICGLAQSSTSWKKRLEKSPSAGKVMITFFGAVIECFLWMQCWERRHSTLTAISGCWQTSGSVSYEFGFTRVWLRTCFNLAMQGCTQVGRLGNTSQNLVGIVTPSTPRHWSSTLIFPPI